MQSYPALALLALACAAPVAPPFDEQEPAPAAAPAADSAGALRLELTLESETPAVHIAFEFPGDADGETVVFESESWGGVGPDREDLAPVRFKTVDGSELLFERLDRHRWSLRHAPSARVAVHADLLRNETSRRESFLTRDYYRPILEPGLLHAIGNLLLPVPDHLRWDEPRDLELVYKGFEEAGWEVVDSFGAGPGPRTARASLGEVHHALYAAGELEVHRRNAAGTPLVVALAAGDWRFDGAELADLVARIVGLERELIGDARVQHYLVHALSVGSPSDQGSSFGGTGLTHSFALFLQPNTELALEAPSGLQLRRLIAHECFHAWNGVRIRLAEPEESCYWFSEGFTDHFARRVLHAAGWLDDEGYARSLSEALERYHTSPARNATAADLGARFWTDRDAQTQPYVRGDVVAALLDHELRSKGSDLWDLLRELLRESDASSVTFSAEDLLERFEARIGSDAAAAIRRIVVGGETAVLPPDAFGPRFEIGERETYAFDPGFDIDATLAALAATGVRAGSAAAAAGLVEGMALSGISIYQGDPNREIELTPAGGAEKITFLPRGAAFLVPEVRVRAEAP